MSEFKFDDLPEEAAVTAVATDLLRIALERGDVRSALEEFCAQLGDVEDQEMAWNEMQIRLGHEQFQQLMQLFGK